jgi:hypothetical protein
MRAVGKIQDTALKARFCNWEHLAEDLGLNCEWSQRCTQAIIIVLGHATMSAFVIFILI